MKLVIVESPAKAKTIQKYLGPDFEVESSIGHIRDLPKSAAEIPARYKDQAWARLGVDVENDFKPLYVIPKEKIAQVKLLKDALKNADELYLATDGDREGEAIAWHLIEVLKPNIPIKRMVFHEITKSAVQHALENPRELQTPLIKAQEARRILDRLYGYELSPVLWRKVRPRLSAGRVQSVATKIVVERERERIRFVPAGYWTLLSAFSAGETAFTARLTAIDAHRVAQSRDFDSDGKLSASGDLIILDEAGAHALAQDLKGGMARVSEVARKPYRRSPAAPFRTSTLQQAASSRMGFSAGRTMSAAQRLYENGLITYMRTDSTTLSDAALKEAMRVAAIHYGADTVAEKPRNYTGKVKNAQEAHEAIRPSGDFAHPDALAKKLVGDEAKLYGLIWRRTVASQMKDALGETVSVTLQAKAGKKLCSFQTSGTHISSPGFKRAYDAHENSSEDEQTMPDLSEGETANITNIESEGKETKPPGRFSEASLIKRLEELGIGRPSTYASIMRTIVDRGYVEKRSSSLVPTFLAIAVVQLLEKHFAHLIDYSFTAEMEDHLDEIARGEEDAQTWLHHFYFGNGSPGLKGEATAKMEEIDAKAINSIAIGNDRKGNPIVARAGRYGPYIQRGEDTAPIPTGIAPDELTVARAEEIFEAEEEEHTLGKDPDTGEEVYVLNGRFGFYVQLGEIEKDSKEKPKRASLFASMSPDSVTLEEALKLLSLPRIVGEDPESKKEITAQNGPYGPYIKKEGEKGEKADNRSLDLEEQIFTVTLEEAVELFKQPKRRRGAQPKPPLKEFGEDPNSQKKIFIKTGRFGPYITDGETNVSLRSGEEPENIEEEDAINRLAEKRAKGPAPKRKPATKKKVDKKKSPKKKK